MLLRCRVGCGRAAGGVGWCLRIDEQASVVDLVDVATHQAGEILAETILREVEAAPAARTGRAW